MNILVNQCKYPGIYNECFYFSCNVSVNDNVNDNVINIVNDNDNANVNVNDNDNVNDNVNDNDNVNVKDNDNVNDNVNDNDNDNDNVSDNDNDNVNDNDNDNVNDKDNDIDKDNILYIYLVKNIKGVNLTTKNIREDSVCGKPSSYTDLNNNISVNINEDLQSWLNDENIITEATLPENFRCIISGSSERGKTLFLKELILVRIYFDKLYIIGPTGDQYEGVDRINDKADVEFVKDIKVKKVYPLPISYPKT